MNDTIPAPITLRRRNGSLIAERPAGSLRELVEALVAEGVPLRGANFCGADLSGADMRCANLAGAYFAGAYFAGANIAGANLTDADLADARGYIGQILDRLRIAETRVAELEAEIMRLEAAREAEEENRD